MVRIKQIVNFYPTVIHVIVPDSFPMKKHFDNLVMSSVQKSLILSDALSTLSRKASPTFKQYQN